MDPQYRNSTTFRFIACPAATVLAVCAAIASCDAADRSVGQIETGQPRDLVNRPECWTREHTEGWYRCAVGVR